MSHRVLVVGSANIDYSVCVEEFPTPGETRLGESLHVRPGGKGLNQAVAAARLGADVYFVGSVGNDADGQLLVRTLQNEGVDTTHLAIDDHERTGHASIYVVPSGQNSIVVAPGANSSVEPAAATAAIRASGRRGDLVVVQAEIPADVLPTTVRTARECGLRAVVNLAPYRRLSAQLLEPADPLVVNEVEAAELVGSAVVDVDSGLRAAQQLSRLAASAVVTLGAAGACWAVEAQAQHIAGPSVPAVVDTLGAGDALVGALAAQLAGGRDLDAALRVAVAAASISVTRAGAQASYARQAELAALM
jgi:ribokinase